MNRSKDNDVTNDLNEEIFAKFLMLSNEEKLIVLKKACCLLNQEASVFELEKVSQSNA